MISPLISLPTDRPTREPQVGDLGTARDFAGRMVQIRITRIDAHNVWGRVIGLAVPQPWAIGDQWLSNRSALVDWGE